MPIFDQSAYEAEQDERFENRMDWEGRSQCECCYRWETDVKNHVCGDCREKEEENESQ